LIKPHFGCLQGHGRLLARCGGFNPKPGAQASRGKACCEPPCKL
jgi:hypothetical protein